MFHFFKYQNRVLLLNPEVMRLYSYGAFALVATVGIVLSLIFSEHYVHHSPIEDFFGFFNVCVFFDHPPATYILPFLWSFCIVFVCLYVLLSIIFAYHLYSARQISKLSYGARSGTMILLALTTMFFSTCFAVQPEQNMLMHTSGYIGLVIGLGVLAGNNLCFNRKLIKVSLTQKKYFITYVVLLYCATFLNLSILFNALLGYPWFNIHTSNYHFYAGLIDKVWFVLAAVFPIFHCLFLIKRTPPLAIQMSISDHKR